MAEDQKLASASGALQNLFGTGDENVRLLEKLMDVHVALRGGDIVVEVTISPIEIMPQITGEFMQETWDAVLSENGITTQEQLDAQFQAMDEQYAMALMDEVERLIPELTYGTDQVVMLQLKEEDGYYSLVDSGLQKLDEIMIDYYGAYV